MKLNNYLFPKKKSKTSRKKLVLSLFFITMLLYVIYLFYISMLLPPLKIESGTDQGEIVGVYHVHTRFSDGCGQVKDVVKAAAKLHLDFILLTDHGHPNYDCLASEGWNEGILVLAGSELSTSRGHLVALAIPPSIPPIPRIAEEAACFVRKQGGFTIIAHPYSKTSWSWGRENDLYTGLELVDADTMLKKGWFFTLPFIPLLFFNPRAFVLKMIDPFPSPFKQWDLLNRTNPPIYGFFSCDAHLMYNKLLRLFCLRLPLEKKLPREFQAARELVLKALQSGNFYNAIEAAQPAAGFRFWAELGDQHFPMGSIIDAPEKEKLTLWIRRPASVAADICLIHNGQKILITSHSEFTYQPLQSGIYRVEVYLREKSIIPENMPWIVSNPLFIRMAKHDAHTF